MKTRLLTYCLFASILTLSGQDLSRYDKIADYPLSKDGRDITGRYSDIQLQNTHFAQGGVYSNGKYLGTTPGGSFIITPQLSGLTTSHFAFRLSFNVDSLPNTLFVFGDRWRWLKGEVAYDSTVLITVSKKDGFGRSIRSNYHVDKGEWYTLGFEYDSIVGSFTLYMNDTLAGSIQLHSPIEMHNDLRVTNEDAGLGHTFKGYWKDLRLYSAKSNAVKTPKDSRIGIYYAPKRKCIYIHRGLRIVEQKSFFYTITNLAGITIQTGILPKGQEQIRLDSYPVGIYVMKWHIAGEEGGFRFAIE